MSAHPREYLEAQLDELDAFLTELRLRDAVQRAREVTLQKPPARSIHCLVCEIPYVGAPHETIWHIMQKACADGWFQGDGPNWYTWDAQGNTRPFVYCPSCWPGVLRERARMAAEERRTAWLRTRNMDDTQGCSMLHCVDCQNWLMCSCNVRLRELRQSAVEHGWQRVNAFRYRCPDCRASSSPPPTP